MSYRPPIIDITGQRFGRLVVTAMRDRRDKWGMVMWDCRCDCGNVKDIASASLRTGRTRSCGCLERESRYVATALDISGKRFGRLIATSALPGAGRKARRWLCICDCGNTIKAQTGNLTNGHTQSCGCLRNFAIGCFPRTPKAEMLAKERIRTRRYTQELNDRYVKSTIIQKASLRCADIPQSLIEAKRVHLKLTRLLKEKANEEHG